MSQQGPDVAKRNKKRKLKPARPLLEQVPAVPAEAPEQQHKHKKPHRQQQPPEQPQEQQPDALNAGNSKFARALGSTDFHTREQGLQALSRWLTHKQLVSELDMLKLWKGIYFCFWHSDKEPVQEDLAERLAGLIPRMQPGMAVLYWSAMLSTLRSEWFALDRHRLNKFLMLVRKFVGAVFTRLAAEDWPITSIQSFTSNLPLVGSVMPLTQARSLGLSYHLADVWLPELRKAAGVKALRQEALQALLEPFVGVLQQSGEAALINRVRESVLEALVQDLSAAAAAAGAGGAASSSDDDEESDSTAWAYCQQLDVTAYASLLFDRGAQEGVRSRNREALYSISKDLERLAGKRRKATAAAAAAAAAAGGAAAGVVSVKKHKHRVQQEQGLQQDGQLQQQQPDSGRKVKKQKHAQQQQQQQQVEEPMANGHVEQPSFSKKQKKQAQQQQQVVEPAVAAVTPDSSHALTRQHKQATAGKKQGTPAAARAAGGAAAAAAGAAGSASALKRGVKIDLKKNLYFEHGAPPPAAEIRTPPRAKPKGSALKSAVQLDSSGRPAGASTAPAGTKQNGAQRRLVTPSSVPRLKASEFF